MTSTSDIFEIWDYGHNSGAGSDPMHARPYIDLVSTFIRENGIRSVVDLGCGDFQVGRNIDYRGAQVTAIDASSRHINKHTEEFKEKSHSLTFVHGDIQTFDDSSYDLALVKDVLQHWPNEDIVTWLKRPHAQLLIVTNDVAGGDVNGDIQNVKSLKGHAQVAVRGLDLRLPPFSVEGEVLLEYNGKRALLLRSSRK